MAKRLRLVSRHSRSIGIADEEQAFLGFHARTDKKDSKVFSGAREWLHNHGYPKHRSSQVFFMVLTILAIIAILTM